MGFELEPVLRDRERFRVMVSSFGAPTLADLQGDTGLNRERLAEDVETLREGGFVEVEQVRKLFGKPRTIIRGTEKARRTFKDWLRYLESKLQEPSPPTNRT